MLVVPNLKMNALLALVFPFFFKQQNTTICNAFIVYTFY